MQTIKVEHQSTEVSINHRVATTSTKFMEDNKMNVTMRKESNHQRSDNTSIQNKVVQKKTQLKCAICQGHLSRAPIMSSLDGTIYHCGRCVRDDPNVSVRNFAYETLAQGLQFPCINSGCKAKIPWKDVERHELKCSYRTMKCPMYNCSEMIQISVVVDHFENCHKNEIANHHFMINWRETDLNYIFVGLLIHCQIPYIMFVYNCESKLRVGIHSIQEISSKKYKLELMEPSGNEIVLGSQDITPYDDKIHCIGCYFGDCTEQHFGPNVLLSSKMKRRMTTEISLECIQAIMQSPIIGFKVSIEIKPSDEFHKGISVLKKKKCPACNTLINSCGCSRLVFDSAKIISTMRKRKHKIPRQASKSAHKKKKQKKHVPSEFEISNA